MSQIQAEIRLAVEGVVARHFTTRLQQVYASLQHDLGIAGDIAPWEIDELESSESAHASVVARWLVGGLSFDQAEALGMDGTRRSDV